MKKPANYTAFFRPAGSYTVAEQRKRIEAWLRDNGGSISQEYDAAELPGARDEWATRTRKNEGAIVSALWLIAEPRTEKGRRPTTDQARALAAIERAAAIVVEAETGITSWSKQWLDRIAEAQDFVAAGRRRLTKRRQAQMAKARAEKAKPGVVERWNDPANRRRFERWQTHWRSRQFKSGVEAYNALPEDVRNDIGSYRMMYKIFKERHPGDKSAGGRPSKLKRKGR